VSALAPARRRAAALPVRCHLSGIAPQTDGKSRLRGHGGAATNPPRVVPPISIFIADDVPKRSFNGLERLWKHCARTSELAARPPAPTLPNGGEHRRRARKPSHVSHDAGWLAPAFDEAVITGPSPPRLRFDCVQSGHPRRPAMPPLRHHRSLICAERALHDSFSRRSPTALMRQPLHRPRTTAPGARAPAGKMRSWLGPLPWARPPLSSNLRTASDWRPGMREKGCRENRNLACPRKKKIVRAGPPPPRPRPIATGGPENGQKCEKRG